VTSPWALVAGSAGAIGHAIALRLVNRGVRVVGVDRRPPSTGSALWRDIVGDVLDSVTLAELRAVASDLGPPRFVVNAIGTYRRQPFIEYSLSDMHSTVQDNLLSPALVLQFAVTEMLTGSGGRIVVITSQAGAAGGTDALYAASKAGVTALVKSIARDFAGHGITCNAVSPGPVDSPMARAMGDDRQSYYRDVLPMGRPVKIEEVAEVSEFLLFTERQCMEPQWISMEVNYDGEGLLSMSPPPAASGRTIRVPAGSRSSPPHAPTGRDMHPPAVLVSNTAVGHRR